MLSLSFRRGFCQKSTLESGVQVLQVIGAPKHFLFDAPLVLENTLFILSPLLAPGGMSEAQNQLFTGVPGKNFENCCILKTPVNFQVGRFPA